MRIPARIPGLRSATLLLVAGFLVWIALEGNLQRSLSLGGAVTLLLLAHLSQRKVGGALVKPIGWLLGCGLAGFAAGLGTGLFTLALMVLKTGLHAHGPEFTAAEFAWVSANIPVWAGAGFLAGAGAGLITLALHRR